MNVDIFGNGGPSPVVEPDLNRVVFVDAPFLGGYHKCPGRLGLSLLFPLSGYLPRSGCLSKRGSTKDEYCYLKSHKIRKIQTLTSSAVFLPYVRENRRHLGSSTTSWSTTTWELLGIYETSRLLGDLFHACCTTTTTTIPY